MLDVVLSCGPARIAVTFTEKLHEPRGGNVAPDKPTELVPATAVIVPPPQDPMRFGGVETTSPTGSVSTKLTPVSVVVVFGFVMRNVSDVDEKTGTVAAPKVLAISGGMGGGAETVVEPDAGTVKPTPPSVKFTETLFTCGPGAVPTTFTVTTHELGPAASAPPVSVTVVPLAVATPPQVLTRAFGVAMVRPGAVAAKLSLKLTFVAVGLPPGLLMVMVMVVVAPTSRFAVPNCLVTPG